MASDKNFVEIDGCFTRDPVIKQTNSGTSVCNFSIASNRFFKKGDGFEKETSFFDIVCFAQLAQDVANNCYKGTPVKVTGRLRQERWTGADGKNQSKISIVADNVLQINRSRNGNNTNHPQGDQGFDCPF